MGKVGEKENKIIQSNKKNTASQQSTEAFFMLNKKLINKHLTYKHTKTQMLHRVHAYTDTDRVSIALF